MSAAPPTAPPPAAPPPTASRPIREALARATYAEDRVRLTGATLARCECLFASRQGLFAVAPDGHVATVAHGHFFGLRAHRDLIYAFEACDRPHGLSRMGRIVRMRRDGDRLVEPVVLVKDLDNQCHQIALFDDALWVVDTGNQAVLQFTPKGAPVARHTPLPVAPRDDETGAYHHINSIAKVGERVVLMLHNGVAPAPRPSELAWLDRDSDPLSNRSNQVRVNEGASKTNLTLRERTPVAGQRCHDIVEDADGVLWHCGSMAGEIVNSAGLHRRISDAMTRGLAVTQTRIVVGSSNFATRAERERVAGHVHFLDRDLTRRASVAVPAAPTDLILL